MYYRYEVKFLHSTQWTGICSLLNPSELRKLNRFLAVPKWYEKHPNTYSLCWFTEYGFRKYQGKMEEILQDMARYRSLTYLKRIKIRLVSAENLKTMSKGKVQCISRDYGTNINVEELHFFE